MAKVPEWLQVSNDDDLVFTNEKLCIKNEELCI